MLRSHKRRPVKKVGERHAVLCRHASEVPEPNRLMKADTLVGTDRWLEYSLTGGGFSTASKNCLYP